MEFLCSTIDLSKAINTLTRIIPSKAYNKGYTYIKISTESGRIRLEASNELNSMQIRVLAQVSDAGECCLDGKLFAEIIRKQPADAVSIVLSGEKVIIKSGSAKQSLAVKPINEFPDVHPIDDPVEAYLPKDGLRECIASVEYATSTDETKKVLCGLLLEVGDGLLRMVAVDGFRFAMRDIPCDYTGEKIKIIIPKESAKEIFSLLGDCEDDEVRIVTDKQRLSMSFGQYKFVTTLITGAFIEYTRVIPESYKTVVKATAKNFRGAVDRSQTISRASKTNLISLELFDNHVHVSSAADFGEVDEDIQAERQGDGLKIAFDARLLMDALKQTDGEIEMGFNSPFSPISIREIGKKDRLNIVLPVRILGMKQEGNE